MSDNQKIWLDGTWDFQHHSTAAADATPTGEWRSVIVPMPWQAQFDDLRSASGTAWYRRSINLEAQDLGAGAAILHFGAVDYLASVWVNGQLAGEHSGGYLPFEFDVMRLLQEGDNELLVKVVDATDDRQRYPEMPFSELPHGKQSWYGPLSGIWQSVWLEFRPSLHIAGIRLQPAPETASIAVQVSLGGDAQQDCQVRCTVSAPDGQVVGSAVLGPDLSGTLHITGAPALWSPETPNLYSVTATLLVNDQPDHAVQKTCGFRTVEARAGRIYLNGAPIYLRGVLDQGYYPETIYTPNSLELLESQAHSAKALGFNCLRIHIKVEDPRYYEVADRLGLFVWTEIPNWALLTEASIARGKETLIGMLARDGHHPSIIAWTLINENWGTDLTRNVEHRRWLADFYKYAKALDPTRLIIDNSACGGNAHVAGDLEDFHNYRAIPDHAQEWDEWLAQFAGRGDEAWYPDFEHERRADLPLVVSEFGNWGLPDPETIKEHGAEPWWFETGFEWDSGIVYPHGVMHRFEACGLAELFPSYAEFSKQAQEHMARSLHYEISGMRLHAPVAGYIVTEFTDVHWECNGLLTMQRQVKHLLDPLLKDMNQDRVVVLRPMQWSGQPGETLTIQARAMGIDGEQKDGRLAWQAGDQRGELPAPGGQIKLTLEKAGVITLHANWLAPDGSQLATNQVDLVCVSGAAAAVRLCVPANAALAASLRASGYQVSEGAAAQAAADEIVVTSNYNLEAQAHVQNGGRVLYLADPTNNGGADESLRLPAGYLSPRTGTVWQGDWANSISWVKKQGAFAHLPGSPLLEMEWSGLMPDSVVAGLPTWALCEHSWAGMVVGWLHKAVSLVTVMPYGRGKLLVTTFKINQSSLEDSAVARALLAGMLNLL